MSVLLRVIMDENGSHATMRSSATKTMAERSVYLDIQRDDTISGTYADRSGK